MVKKTSLYEEKNIKTWIFRKKKKVSIKNEERVYEFFGLRKSWYYGFLGVNG